MLKNSFSIGRIQNKTMTYKYVVYRILGSDNAYTIERYLNEWGKQGFTVKAMNGGLIILEKPIHPEASMKKPTPSASMKK